MSLTKSTIWYSAGNLFSRFIGFILLPFYSHLIPKEAFARYALIMSAYAVLAAVYQGGIFSGFTKYFVEASDINARKKIFSSVFLVILISAAAFSLIITLFAAEIADLVTSSVYDNDLIIIAAWMLFFDTLYMTILHLLKTLELPGKVIIVTTFSAVINVLLNLYFVYIIHIGINGILLAQLISGGFALTILLPVIKEYYSGRFDKETIKSILYFSIPLLIAGILSTLVDVADRFILDALMDKEAVGIYSFSYRIAIVMNIFIISYRTAWTPLSIRLYNNNQNFSTYSGKSLNKLIGILFFIFIVVSLLVDDLFHLKIAGITFFSQEYEPGLVIIPFILAGYAFSGIISFYSVYPYVSGKSIHFLVTDAISFGVNIILNLLLIPVWGITGAAVATAISFLAGAIYLRIISDDIKIKYEYRDMSLIMFAGILFFGAGYYLKLPGLDILIIILYGFILVAVLKLKPVDFFFKKNL